MRASRSLGSKHCFVLEKKNITKINKAVRNFLRENAVVTYSMQCKDGITREVDDANKVAEYDNVTGKEITSIRMSGRSGWKRECTVELGKGVLFDNVRIDAKGGEAAIETFFTSIQEELVNMRPWYRRFAVINFVSLFMDLLGLISVGLFAVSMSFVVAGKFSFREAFTYHGFELPLVLTIFFICAFVGIGCNSVRSRLFPLAAFAIGAGAKRHEEADWWRKTFVGTVVIGGMLVGGSVAILANVITR